MLRLPARALRRGGTVALAAATTVLATTVVAPGTALAVPGCVTPPDFDHSVPMPAPAVSVSSDTSFGFTNVAILGADRHGYTHIAEFTGVPPFEPGENSVGPLECTGGTGVGEPAAVSFGTKIQYFTRGTNGLVYVKQRSTDDPTWSAFVPVPGASAFSGVEAIMSSESRTDIFYISSASTRHIVHQSQVDGVWSAPESMGGKSLFTPSVTLGADGRFHAWVTATNGSIYNNVGDVGGTGTWRGWVSFGGRASSGPAASVGFEPTLAREDIFVIATDGSLYQGTATNLGAFTGWQRLGDSFGPGSQISAASSRPDSIVVYGVSTLFDTVVFKEYDQVLGGWQPLLLPAYTCDPQCLPVGDPAVASRTAGPYGPLRGTGRAWQPAAPAHR